MTWTCGDNGKHKLVIDPKIYSTRYISVFGPPVLEAMNSSVLLMVCVKEDCQYIGFAIDKDIWYPKLVLKEEPSKTS